jgi:hypothetical protein
MIALPALAAVTLMFLGGLQLTKTFHLTGAQKVSAAELMKKSQAYYTKFDASKYSFFSFSAKYHSVAGENFEACGKSYSDSIAGDSATKTYIYRSRTSNVEAGYFYSADDTGITNVTHYYNTNSAVLGDYMPESIGTSPYTTQYMVNGKLAYVLVDENGQPLTSSDLSVVRKNGRDVYDFYIKPNKSVLSPLPACENVIQHVVLDADTYAEISVDTYMNKVTPEALITSSTSETQYKDISETEALRIMADAGFVKDKAVTEMPKGKD